MRRPPSLPLRILVVALLLPAAPAWASDFGCLAEWLDLALVPASIPLAALGLWSGWRLDPARALGGASGVWLLGAVGVAATTCTYGNDADAPALAALTLALAVTAASVAWRARSRGEDG